MAVTLIGHVNAQIGLHRLPETLIQSTYSPEDWESPQMRGHPLGLGTSVERRKSRRKVVPTPAGLERTPMTIETACAAAMILLAIGLAMVAISTK